MKPEDKRKLMLSVLAILLIARFILVPIFDWQQEQILSLEAKQQRLVKTDDIISRLPQINVKLAELKTTNLQLQARYFEHTSSNAFKLELQQKIEALFSKYELKISNFSWVVEIPNQISEARAKISFEGTTANYAMLQLAIAQSPKLLNVVQWTLQIKRMNSKSLGKVNGSLLLSAYSIAPPVEVQSY